MTGCRAFRDWLELNGEAIYGTRRWRRSCQWSAGERPAVQYGGQWRLKYDVGAIAGRPAGAKAVVEAFFTAKGDTLYAITPWWPARPLVLKDVPTTPRTVATMLGVDKPLPWKAVGEEVVVEVPKLTADQLPCKHAYVIKLTHVE